MTALGTGLLVMAYLLAVVDGVRDRHLLYEGNPMGFRRFVRAHPWILLGAVSGSLGTVLLALGS